MDKKKVIENLNQVEFYINKLQGLNYTQLQLLKSAIFRLHDAQEEINKIDWISVEDELPHYGERVIVCDKNKPNDIRASVRREYLPSRYNFLSTISDSITHWRKIDKLKEE